MISTATAFTNACAKRGSGPKIAQAVKVSTATNHRRDELGCHHVRQPLNRRAAPLCFTDHAHNLASSVSLPTRSARITKLPVPLTVAPVTAHPLPSSPEWTRR